MGLVVVSRSRVGLVGAERLLGAQWGYWEQSGVSGSRMGLVGAEWG